MGIRAAIAHGVLDAIRAGDIPNARPTTRDHLRGPARSLGGRRRKPRPPCLFTVHREATAKAIKMAMSNDPTIEWLLKNQDKVKRHVPRTGG
jgi:5,6,7,8-tetrahydromethanopterin hydro-lyase